MQETLIQSEIPKSASTRSIERIWTDRRIHGSVLPETMAQIIDEEKTHAAEIVALVTGRGTIARHYRLVDGDLVDDYGEGLAAVFDGGIADAVRKIGDIPGADWELHRRVIERENFIKKILSLKEGQACVETSSTDLTKPESERKYFGYNGDTILRITARGADEHFYQDNIVIPSSDPRFLRRLKKRLSGEVFDSSEDLLENPDIVSVDTDIATFVRNIETETNYALLRFKPGLVILRMMKRTRDAWEVIEQNKDVFEQLATELQVVAQQNPQEWEKRANTARGGTWQLLIETATGRGKHNEKSISAAVQRATAEGTSFTACGGTVDMAGIRSMNSLTFIDRILITRELRDRQSGVGNCNACHASSLLYGCGVYCHGCNEVWCDEFDRTGTQLEDHEVLERKYWWFLRLPTLSLL